MQSARPATEFLRRDTTPSQSLLVAVDLQKARRLQRAGQAANQNAPLLEQLGLPNRSRAGETEAFGVREPHFLQR